MYGTPVEKEIEKKMKLDNVVAYMKDNLDGDAYEKRWLKPLLLLIEYSRTDDAKLIWIDWDKDLQVEHILPIQWSTDHSWRNNWQEELAEFWLQKIGNLTLLSGKKNIAASNDSFNWSSVH